jgi:tRNA A37 threonylcarbamoyladenosine biosynthesis protein TsaE
MIIEWAEKIMPLLPGDLLHIGFEILSARKRRITFTTGGKRFTSLFKELRLP